MTAAWIDPNLLQLFALGADGDAQLPDGRHLRWFPGRLLGFPRSGFRLRRRPSRTLAPWTTDDTLVRLQRTGQTDLGAGSSKSFTNGLTVSCANGFTFVPVTSSAGPVLRIDATAVTLELGPDGAPPFAPGPQLSNPAAFVRLTVARRKTTGWVTATAGYDSRTAVRQLDRIVAGTPGLVTAPPADPNPWMTQTFLLGGGLIDHVELIGHEAALVRVQWLTVRDYAGDDGWTELGRFWLPLTDAPDLYPAWTSASGEDIARERIDQALPLAQVPWDDPPLPPATVTPNSIADDLHMRYLGSAFQDVDDALRLFLRGELTQVVPQALVESTDTLLPDDGNPDGITQAVTRPFEHVYGAAIDPEVARLLGLMSSDFTDATGTYDYVIDADFPRLWIDWTVQPDVASAAAAAWRSTLGGNPLVAQALPVENVLSMVTAVVRATGLTVQAPDDLRALVKAEPGRHPIEARVEVSWRRGPDSLFEHPDRALVLYAFLRTGGGADDEKLHFRDDDPKLLVPHVPTERASRDGRLRLVDRTIPTYGFYVWRVAGLDVWGRLSPYASVAAEVRDLVAPPAPTPVTAELLGSTADAPVFTEVVLSFDWDTGAATLAPDTVAFELHLRQGALSVADGALPASWGRFEHSTGATSPPVRVNWPNAILGPLPTGLTGSISISPIPDDEGGGSRLALRIGPIHVPFDDAGIAAVSATVRAIDTSSNASGFAQRTLARRFLERAPPLPPLPTGVVWASLGDALGRSFYRVSWPDLGRGRVQVLRAPEAALLDAGGVDPAAYAALDPIARGDLLRGIALAHPERFAADHEYPYPATPGEHLIELGGASRAYTVITLSTVGDTETRSPWPNDPTRFLVLAVPALPGLRAPLVRELRAGDRRVSARVAADLTGLTARLRLYRARRADDTVDVRRMRLVGEVSVPAVANSAAPPPDLVITDSTALADVDYWYRVMALDTTAAQSPASGAARAQPYSSVPPRPPEIVQVRQAPGGAARRLVTGTIERRDYALTLFRRRRGALDWSHGAGAQLRNGVVALAALATEAVPGGYQFTVEDEVPDAGDVYFYFLRVMDSRGRMSDSAINGDPT